MNDANTDSNQDSQAGEEALRPPDGFDQEIFEDLPEWGQEQILEWRHRRKQSDVEYARCLASELLRGTITGGIMAALLAPILPGGSLPLTLALTCLAAFLGRQIIRREWSPMTGAAVFGGTLAVATLANNSLVSLVTNSTNFVTAFSSMRLFLVWVMWLAAGGFIALTAERSRQQRVPY